jgi:hypothetical protein
MPRVARIWSAVAVGLMLASAAVAGVINPNISVVGQPFVRWNDDVNDSNRKRAVFDVGETEFVYDDYLNPYARGFFTLALAEEGMELEEGFFSLLRGLPGGVALKGGKYRVGFGKLNPVHPHAYPFSERFRVLANYLPGEESYNEMGLELSGRVPTPGDVSVTLSADWLRGDTFRVPRESSGDPSDPLESGGAGDREGENRPAGLGRLSVFAPIEDRSGVEFGLTATQGTNNVAAATRTTVLGGDAKLKYWTSANAYLVVQGEVLRLDREDAGWDPTALAYAKTSVKPIGGYLYADYNFKIRYNFGASFERYQQPTTDKTWDQAFGLFAGFALMEETTAFRFDWNHFMPGTPPGSVEPDAVNYLTLRILFSMGPHKAHQF